MIKTVVAAAPGFDVVEVLHGRPPELAYAPIIAWVVAAGCEEGVWPSARPVWVDWENNGPNETIRLPNGDIIFSEGRGFTAVKPRRWPTRSSNAGGGRTCAKSGPTR
jgi:hypothetical protein